MRKILIAAAGALFVPLFASPPLEAQQVKARLCGGKPMPAIPAEATREARRQGHRGTPGFYRCDQSGWVYVPGMSPIRTLEPPRAPLSEERENPRAPEAPKQGEP